MTNSRIFLMGTVLTLMLTGGFSCRVQQPKAQLQESKTKLESFQKQSGIVFVKGYSEIGAIYGTGSVSVGCMELTDATTKTRQMGLVVEVKESGDLENSNKSYIDYDEIDALLQGIQYITNINRDATKLDNLEVTYQTRGDFSVVTFNSGAEMYAGVQSGTIQAARAFLSIPQLDELRNLILQAKQKLDALR